MSTCLPMYALGWLVTQKTKKSLKLFSSYFWASFSFWVFFSSEVNVDLFKTKWARSKNRFVFVTFLRRFFVSVGMCVFRVSIMDLNIYVLYLYLSEHTYFFSISPFSVPSSLVLPLSFTHMYFSLIFSIYPISPT